MFRLFCDSIAQCEATAKFTLSNIHKLAPEPRLLFYNFSISFSFLFFPLSLLLVTVIPLSGFHTRLMGCFRLPPFSPSCVVEKKRGRKGACLTVRFTATITMPARREGQKDAKVFCCWDLEVTLSKHVSCPGQGRWSSCSIQGD